MTKFLPIFAALFFLVAAPDALARRHSEPSASAPGLANATVLIIRHAEDAPQGRGLSAAGQARAAAYARYFRPFRLGQEQLRIDILVAAADSRASDRSRLTLEPLSRASSLPVQQPVTTRHINALVRWLAQGAPHRTILIAWHHGDLPDLIAGLGADPIALLSKRHWPSSVYDWVVVLRFDSNGTLIPQANRLVREPAFAG
jgi:hypothetical protein